MIIPFYPIKDQFKESFCAMDISKINLILDIDRNFCKVSKIEFVASLSRIFNYLKLLGEDSFDVYGAKCISTSCCNCNKDVVIFTSSKFKYYIAFMVEDDKERIFQIAECFSYDFKSPLLQTRLLLNDYVDVNWPQKEHDLVGCCIRELYPVDNYLPSFDEFTFWYNKTLKFKNSIVRSNKTIKCFMDFYSDINSLYNAKERVKYGYESYEKLDLQDEASIVFWLAEQEKTIEYFGTFFLNNNLEAMEDFKNDISGEGKFFYDLSEFANYDRFETIFYQLYNPVYRKFDIEKHFFRFQNCPLLGRLKELNILVDSGNLINPIIDYEINHENLKIFNDNYLTN
jgi:hypothetical protein